MEAFAVFFDLWNKELSGAQVSVVVCVGGIVTNIINVSRANPNEAVGAANQFIAREAILGRGDYTEIAPDASVLLCKFHS